MSELTLDSFLSGLKHTAYPEAEAIPKTHCLECGREAFSETMGYTPTMFFTDAGMREFHISQLCEVCWDEVMRDEED
jgi:hypothetical protein